MSRSLAAAIETAAPSLRAGCVPPPRRGRDAPAHINAWEAPNEALVPCLLMDARFSRDRSSRRGRQSPCALASERDSPRHRHLDTGRGHGDGRGRRPRSAHLAGRLLGRDLRGVLWDGLLEGVAPDLFGEAATALDAEGFLQQVTAQLGDLPDDRRVMVLRCLRYLPAPRSAGPSRPGVRARAARRPRHLCASGPG